MISVSLRTTATIEELSPAVRTARFFTRKWLIPMLKIVLFLTFCHPGAVQTRYNNRDEFCPIGASVDLTYAKAVTNASGCLADSGYFFPREATRFKGGLWRGCICDIKPCLALCPPLNMMRIGESYFADDYANYSAIPRVYNENLTIDDDEETRNPEQWFYIVMWDPCQGKGGHVIRPEEQEEDKFYLLKDGSLLRPRINESEERLLNYNQYCLHLQNDDLSYTPKLCFSEKEADPCNAVQYLSLLISVPFLATTVTVYSVLPELRNSYGLTLRCYLCCLIATYVGIPLSKIPALEYDDILFFCLEPVIYFSFVAAVLWLNVMSFDIWWRFSDFGSLRSNGPAHDLKKFTCYSIYAWGIAGILTTSRISTQVFPPVRRFIGWKAAQILFIFGPVGATIICNICLFVLTSIKMVQHNKITRRNLKNEDSRCHVENKHWFSLHLKLFVAMGILMAISWSTLIISWLGLGPKYLWMVPIVVDVLQGVLIFVIFVCKRNIWLSLRKRFKNGKLPVFNCQRSSCVSTSENTLSDSLEVQTAVTDDKKKSVLRF